MSINLETNNSGKSLDTDTNLKALIADIAAGLTEVFEALRRIASGDPTVKIPENSEMELMTKLKQMVNSTAQEVGNMIGQTHEIAIGLAEHFDVLHRVSQGDFHARVSGSSHVELLEVLKKVTNEMIENIKQEITARKDVTNALAESEEKYRSLVESSDDSIYVVNRDYRYVFINEKHLGRLGLSGKRYVGRSYGDFHSPEETELFIEKAKRVFDQGQSVYHEYQSVRDGSYFLLTLSPVRSTEGEIIAVTVLSKDITEYKMMEEKLRKISFTDQLTDLYNRRGFFTLAEHQLKTAKRRKKDMYLVYVDLDNMKAINDKYGHEEGDKALIRFAQILKENYRESDVIARVGGDEFAIILPEADTYKNVEHIVARMEDALKKESPDKNKGYKLSASIGVAYYDPALPVSLDGLLAHADRTMYMHKQYKKKYRDI
jgi:diguanylate cyclase (GGDEF)-like protein/PAS domain S-box-containing protein